MKNIKNLKFSSENYHFYSREILLYIARTCLRNESVSVIIRVSCPYDIDPLRPHFYIVILGFTGVYIISLSLLLNIDCWYSLGLPVTR